MAPDGRYRGAGAGAADAGAAPGWTERRCDGQSADEHDRHAVSERCQRSTAARYREGGSG